MEMVGLQVIHATSFRRYSRIGTHAVVRKSLMVSVVKRIMVLAGWQTVPVVSESATIRRSHRPADHVKSFPGHLTGWSAPDQ